MRTLYPIDVLAASVQLFKITHLKHGCQSWLKVCDRPKCMPKCLLHQTARYSKVDIVLEGGLPVLIEMMHSADVETAHQGTGVVANLAEVVENQGKMVESGESLQQPRLHSNDIEY